jgi:hypothetical protein
VIVCFVLRSPARNSKKKKTQPKSGAGFVSGKNLHKNWVWPRNRTKGKFRKHSHFFRLVPAPTTAPSMPAEHCTPSVPLVDVVGKHYNKTSASLKRRTCDGSFYNPRHSVAPHKRRRVDLKSDGSERVYVVRRNHKGQANNRHLARILGIRKPQTTSHASPAAELQEQIQALQHILSLVELPITPPPSPVCTQVSQWNVKLYDYEKEGSCEVLASASFTVKEDVLGVPFNTYVPLTFLALLL